MLKRLVCAALICLPLAACEVSKTVSDPLIDEPTLRIADAAHNGDQHFYFLPPLAWQPEYTGDFDASQQPQVNICALDDTDCVDVATYSTGVESNGAILKADPQGEFYHLNWHTNLFELTVGSVYRIRVLLNGSEVGYLDVLLVENKSDLRSAGRDGLIRLVDGRTAPIKFRIEQGIVTNQEPEPPVEPNNPDPPPAIPEGSILGMVTDDAFAALPGITVSALDNGVVVSQATTAADGSYVLPVSDLYPFVKVRFEDATLAYQGECFNDVHIAFCSYLGALVPRGSVAVDAVLTPTP